MGEWGQMLLGLGVKAEQLRPDQAALRAVVVYVVALAIVRLGKRRLLARATAFDVVVIIVIGSLAGRAVTGNAPLGTALAGIAGIVAVHWIVSALALRSHAFGELVKGRSSVIVRDGVVDEAMLRAEHMTKEDLDEDLRQKGRKGLDGVLEGRLERSGQLSILSSRSIPRWSRSSSRPACRPCGSRSVDVSASRAVREDGLHAKCRTVRAVAMHAMIVFQDQADLRSLIHVRGFPGRTIILRTRPPDRPVRNVACR